MNHTVLRAPLTEDRRSKGRKPFPVGGLGSIEATLVKARTDAQAIEEPVIAYFIDMAIAEVKRQFGFQESGNRLGGEYVGQNALQLMD
jgi:hypothetical protein